MTADDMPRPRSRLPRIPLTVAAGVALVLGAAGYTIGRAQGGSTERSPTSTCEAAQAALHQHLATADPKDATAAHTIANLVVGNASCFDPETVAEMQTMLDGLR